MVGKVSTVAVFDSDGGELRHRRSCRVWSAPMLALSVAPIDRPRPGDVPYGASLGVSRSEGGGGRLIRVGAFVAIVIDCLESNIVRRALRV